MQPDPGHLGLPLDVALVFTVVVGVSVWTDLRMHRGGREISVANAVVWSLVWIALGCGFGLFVRFRFGPSYASDYFAGYALEKALSIDNLMVFIAVFTYFNIGGALQHRILYFGILGALIFRGIFALGGTALLALGPGVELFFGAIVFLSAIQLLRSKGDDDREDYSDHKVVQMARRFLPVFHRLDGSRFFIPKERARVLLAEYPPSQPLNRPVGGVTRWVSPALVCLGVIEVSDLMFAFDSVPAVIAVTREPVLVYAAMIFAILGLRSLYFVLAALSRSLVHLEKAVFCLLFFIGGKLWLSASDEIWHWFSARELSHFAPLLAALPGHTRLDAFGWFLAALVAAAAVVVPLCTAIGALLLQPAWLLASAGLRRLPGIWRKFPRPRPDLWKVWRPTLLVTGTWLGIRAPLFGLAEYLTVVIRQADDIHVSPTGNLVIVLGILLAGVVASLLFPVSRDGSTKEQAELSAVQRAGPGE